MLSPKLAFGCCFFVAGAPALLSLYYWEIVSPQELLFSCDGDFGIGMRSGADDVDDDIIDGFGNEFWQQRDSAQEAWRCWDRGLFVALRGAVGTVAC